MHSSEFNNIKVWIKSHDDLDSSWLLIDILVAGSWLLPKSHDTLLNRLREIESRRDIDKYNELNK